MRQQQSPATAMAQSSDAEGARRRRNSPGATRTCAGRTALAVLGIVAAAATIGPSCAEETTATATTTSAANTALHEQCIQLDPAGMSSAEPNRPMLRFKYARTGSTWLAWTGSKLRLRSGLSMTWIHETQKCMLDTESPEEEAADLTTWLSEYFGKVPMEEALVNTRANLKNGGGSKHVNHQCLVTAGKNMEEMGSNIATLNPHASHLETPDLTDGQWADIFAANPTLAMGVLVRTNSVKRAISGIASEVQRQMCGSKKLHGDEDCIDKLPKTLRLDPQLLMDSIVESERKQIIVTEEAARLSRLHGDGKIFCLSYEAMQLDLAGGDEGSGRVFGRAHCRGLDRGTVERAARRIGVGVVQARVGRFARIFGELRGDPRLFGRAVAVFVGAARGVRAADISHLWGLGWGCCCWCGGCGGR